MNQTVKPTTPEIEMRHTEGLKKLREIDNIRKEIRRQNEKTKELNMPTIEDIQDKNKYKEMINECND